MGKFIEEFYYGNLDPQARSTKENKAVQKQMEVLMLNEDFLTENLSGESKNMGTQGTVLCVEELSHNPKTNTRQPAYLSYRQAAFFKFSAKRQAY